MKQKDILVLENRKILYKCIKENPGLHLRELFRKLDSMSGGTIRHHIKDLKKRGLITEKSEKGYTRYYTSDEISSQKKEFLPFLRQETPCNIILYLLVSIYGSQKTLSKELNKNPATILFHLKKLIDKDVIKPVQISDGRFTSTYKNAKFVECEKNGKEVMYILSDSYTIYELLILNEDAMANKLIKDTLDCMKFLFYTKKRTIKSNEEREEELIGILCDIFPPPIIT